MLKANEAGFYPYTPATNLLYGLHEALLMLEEEGLQNVFRRHARYGEATRAAVKAWGLDVVCEEPLEHSNSLTAVMMPEGHNADRLRDVILETLSGVEMGLELAGVPHRPSGVQAALGSLISTSQKEPAIK
jgi:alanine-glyoxylate transaminase/serine-glyoxylate transaminase/serine-pyruvate transaminase